MGVERVSSSIYSMMCTAHLLYQPVEESISTLHVYYEYSICSYLALTAILMHRDLLW